MHTVIDVVNVALARLGVDSINSLQDSSKPARVASRLVNHSRDVLLAKYAWNFANKTVSLVESTETHPIYTYVYDYPSDCITPLRFIDTDLEYYRATNVTWERWQEYIVTEMEAIAMLYTSKVELYSKYPPLFSEALSAVLTAELCPALIQDKKLYRELLEVAEIKILQAQEADANDGLIYPTDDEDIRQDTFNYPNGYENEEKKPWDRTG